MQRASGRREIRGATLIEVVVALVILAVLTAVAAPAMVPLVNGSRLVGSAEEVAGFVELARRTAMTSGRCHRILQDGNTLRLDERDSPDCVDLTVEGWTRRRGLHVPNEGVTVTLNAAQAIGGPALDEWLIFRPNGRLRGNTNLTSSDDGVQVLVSTVSNPNRGQAVRVTPLGRICIVSFFNGTPAPPDPMVCP